MYFLHSYLPNVFSLIAQMFKQIPFISVYHSEHVNYILAVSS